MRKPLRVFPKISGSTTSSPNPSCAPPAMMTPLRCRSTQTRILHESLRNGANKQYFSSCSYLRALLHSAMNRSPGRPSRLECRGILHQNTPWKLYLTPKEAALRSVQILTDEGECHSIRGWPVICNPMVRARLILLP